MRQKDRPDHIVRDLHLNAVTRRLTVISGKALLYVDLINGADRRSTENQTFSSERTVVSPQLMAIIADLG